MDGEARAAVRYYTIQQLKLASEGSSSVDCVIHLLCVVYWHISADLVRYVAHFGCALAFRSILKVTLCLACSVNTNFDQADCN